MKFISHSSPNNWGYSVEIMEKKGRAFARIYWYNEDETIVYLDMLDVSESYRKKGIATKLQEMREEIGRKLGATFSYLWVFKDTWMYDWYVRRGYLPIGDYENEKNAVWMKKKLI